MPKNNRSLKGSDEIRNILAKNNDSVLIRIVQTLESQQTLKFHGKHWEFIKWRIDPTCLFLALLCSARKSKFQLTWLLVIFVFLGCRHLVDLFGRARVGREPIGKLNGSVVGMDPDLWFTQGMGSLSSSPMGENHNQKEPEQTLVGAQSQTDHGNEASAKQTKAPWLDSINPLGFPLPSWVLIELTT